MTDGPQRRFLPLPSSDRVCGDEPGVGRQLAIAVQRAGAFPSLSIPNDINGDRFDLAKYRGELRTYKDATGSNNLLLSVGSSLLLQDAVMRPFLDLGFRRVELFHWRAGDADWRAVLERSGRQLPATGLIVSGGIHSAAQVVDDVERGALAVAIGSLFAAARESAVADSVKQKIIASTAGDLQTHRAGHLKGLYARVLPGDNGNLTRTLAAGIRDAGAGGIFIGSAVDPITELLSVQQIVDRLVSPR